MKIHFFLGILISVFIMTMSSCQKTCNQVEKLDINCHNTREYDPVCGCNGKTYVNSGEAYCHGITEYTKGACL